MPYACINVGLVPLSQNECLILGGFSERKNLNSKLKVVSHVGSHGSSNSSDIWFESIEDSKLEHADFFQTQSYYVQNIEL